MKLANCAMLALGLCIWSLPLMAKTLEVEQRRIGQPTWPCGAACGGSVGGLCAGGQGEGKDEDRGKGYTGGAEAGEKYPRSHA